MWEGQRSVDQRFSSALHPRGWKAGSSSVGQPPPRARPCRPRHRERVVLHGGSPTAREWPSGTGSIGEATQRCASFDGLVDLVRCLFERKRLPADTRRAVGYTFACSSGVTQSLRAGPSTRAGPFASLFYHHDTPCVSFAAHSEHFYRHTGSDRTNQMF